MPNTNPGHWHCMDGCEKSAGVQQHGGEYECVLCGGPFKPCTPETCPNMETDDE